MFVGAFSLYDRNGSRSRGDKLNDRRPRWTLMPSVQPTRFPGRLRSNANHENMPLTASLTKAASILIFQNVSIRQYVKFKLVRVDASENFSSSCGLLPTRRGEPGEGCCRRQ